MSRSVKDSDEDVESKIGRRTRAALGNAVTDSPVRRSNRNKGSAKQTSCSPDELITEISTPGTRTFRTRAGTADSNTLDAQKRLRSNKNFADTDTELSLETQPKKMTRRSLAATVAPETPKANTRPKRLTRAGSESKSTPSRSTRKTRASSMDPEPTVVELTEEVQSEIINTPMKVKRRASILPKQSTLIEEEEKVPVVELEKMLIEIDKPSVEIITVNETTPNKSIEEIKSIDKIVEEKDLNSAKGLVDDSSQNKLTEINEAFKNDANSLSDKMNTPKKEENPVVLTIDVSTDSLHDSSIEFILRDENTLNVSIEKDKELNSSNKENECSNVNNSMSEQNKSIFNPKNIRKETSTVVMDTSVKEKNVETDVENNDNIKLDGSCLTESSSMSSLDFNNTIIDNSNVNTNNVHNLGKENKRISVSNTEENSSNEQVHETTSSSNNEKENKSTTKNLNESYTVSHKVNEKDSIPKEQSEINDDNNSQIQSKTIIEEEQSLKTITQNKGDPEEETNSNEEIKDKANVSVNPKEILTDTPVKKDNCRNDVSATEISNVENDEKKCDQTAEVVPTCKDSTVIEHVDCPTNDNQDMATESTIESYLALEVSNDSIKDPSNDTNSTKCSLKLQSSELSNTICEKIDSSTVTESHDIPEADLSDKKKESKMRSLSNTPVMSKEKLVTESSILKSKEKKMMKDDVQDDEDIDDDDVSNIKELFQDISADKWKQKSKEINTETQNISKHSATVKLETDSETECDLLLVDKQAWLAAEKLKAIKNKEKFDYDSDDTIVLKTELDYLNDKLRNKSKLQDDANDNDTNSKIKENTEQFDSSSKQLDKEVQDELDEVEDISNKSINKTITDKNDMNVSSHSSSTSKKEKSRRSRSSRNVSKSELSKSLDKQLEESDKEISLTQKVSENVEAKATVDVNKVEVNPSKSSKLRRSSLDKKQNKSRSLSSSLNSSLNSSINKTNKSKLKSKKRKRLNISSSEEEENDDNSESDNNEITRLQLDSGKKRVNPNYSTMVHIGSDSSDSSDSCDESMDSNKKNKTPKIPRFLFELEDDKEKTEEDNDSDNLSVEGKFSDISIDSDIKAEYNLDGKDRKFSDDDIPGDECRASESEFSDPDDNGSDLADFVVDDDEVEEEEEEEEEDDDDDDEEDEEDESEKVENKEKDENEEEEEEVEIEMEVEEQEEDKENEKENTKLTENMNRTKEIDSKNTTISYEEKDNEIDDEKTSKGSSNKKMNISNVKSEKKKTSKENISMQLNFSGSDEDKIVSDTISELDSSTSGKKQKQKQKLSENSEATQETQNDTKFTRRSKESNIPLTCSTPKINVLSKQKLKYNTPKGGNDRKSVDKVLTNEEQEKINTPNVSADNSETNTSTMSDSKTTKKKCSIKSNSLATFIGFLKDGALPNMVLPKNLLNKSVSPCNETPNTKFLKKEKLSDSFPNIKLRDKKNISKTTDINDHQKDEREEDENSETITVDVSEQLESNSSSLSTKRKRSLEMIDLNDQTELKSKKNKVSTKLEKYTGIDNENENFESELKNDDKKKATKSKKNKKNKNAKKELETANIVTASMVKKNINKDEEMEIVCSNNETKNKNKNKKNKHKKNIEIEDKNNEKLITTAEDDNIPNKKRTKITSEFPTLQVKEKSRKLLQKNVIKSSDAEESVEGPSNTQFVKSKHEALEAAKLAIEKIKTGKGKNKNNQKDQSQGIQQQEKGIKIKKPNQTTTKISTHGIKRLPADVIENLSDVPTNPFKKQKLMDKSMQRMTKSNTSMTKSGFVEGYVTKARKLPSNSGGTTEFNIVNLQKAKKQLKNVSPTIRFFRNNMLNRNTRCPTSSYIMYLQKQKAVNNN